MESYTDKRACKRLSYNASIAFSYFNKENCYEAQTLNHGDGGVCFESNVLLQPGATVYIRVKKIPPKSACSSDCRGLRSVTLAEVKWCKEFLNGTESFYEIGAKYYEPEY